MPRFFLWLMFISLTPAGPELVEWITHYAIEGDFADAPDATHQRAPADQQEHGCAALCHTCDCHGPTAPVRDVSQSPQSLQPPDTTRWPSLELSAELPAPQPVPPPPIA